MKALSSRASINAERGNREEPTSSSLYDETVISPHASPAATLPHLLIPNLPAIQPGFSSCETASYKSESAHSVVVPEVASGRSEIVYNTPSAGLPPIMNEETPRCDDYSPTTWPLMPLSNDGPAALPNVALSTPYVFLGGLESMSENALLSGHELPMASSVGTASFVDSTSEGEIWSSIQQFFDTMHVIFPVLSYPELSSRVILQPAWSAAPELRTLLLAMRVVLAAGEYRITSNDDKPLKHFTLQAEKSRLCYDFAESPTLDEVVISLFLFTSYNVLEKHSRAFLYLDEALSLMEAVEVEGHEEERRKMEVEQVLYNTDTATLAIYAGKSRRRKAKKPSLHFEHPPTACSNLELRKDSDRVALHLLMRLTEIHVAEDAETLRIISTASEVDMETLFGAGFATNRYCRIQAADVAVTRQWQLSTKLVAGLSQHDTLSRVSQSQIDNLGTAALAWICLLREGEPRIVGLGKLSGLAKNMVTLSGGNAHSYAIAGLVSAIIRDDHEKKFAPGLAGIVLPMVSTIPMPLGLFAEDDMESEIDNQADLWLDSIPNLGFHGAMASPVHALAGERTGSAGVEDLDWCIDLP